MRGGIGKGWKWGVYWEVKMDDWGGGNYVLKGVLGRDIMRWKLRGWVVCGCLEGAVMKLIMRGRRV